MADCQAWGGRGDRGCRPGSGGGREKVGWGYVGNQAQIPRKGILPIAQVKRTQVKTEINLNTAVYIYSRGKVTSFLFNNQTTSCHTIHIQIMSLLHILICHNMK